jgi:hypothetical protein
MVFTVDDEQAITAKMTEASTTLALFTYLTRTAGTVEEYLILRTYRYVQNTMKEIKRSNAREGIRTKCVL